MEFALHSGSPTHFNAWELPGFGTVAWLRNKFSLHKKSMLCRSPVFFRIGPELQSLLIDVASLADHINRGSDQAMSAEMFHNTLILLGYRLIELNSSKNDRLGDRTERVLHIGLLAFISTFLVEINGVLPKFPALYDSARSLIGGKCDGDNIDRDVLVWALVLARTTIFEEADDFWLIPTAMRAIQALNLQTWDDLEYAVSRLPWIHCIHDPRGQVFWRNASTNFETLMPFPMFKSRPVEDTVQGDSDKEQEKSN
jgi:hypothetical protein